MPSRRKILISLVGTSPAVVTETVYCLASEDPQTAPDEIVAITTSKGKGCIAAELFEAGVWKRMLDNLSMPSSKCSFSTASCHIRVIPNSDKSGDTDDIIHSADNESAADFIMETLRQFTENPDTEIVFSIAGGRKTMSALGALAMSMLGRECDRLCHVLVSPPFDNPGLSPKFHYPGSSKSHLTPDGKRLCSTEAIISLCDIPFVRLRNLFQKEHLRLPGTFCDTVNLANAVIHPESIEMPHLSIRPERMELSFNDIKVSLTPGELCLYWLLATLAKNGQPPLRGQKALLDEFLAFCASTSPENMPEITRNARFANKTDDDLRKMIHSISRKLRAVLGSKDYLLLCLPSRADGVYGIAMPPRSIDCPRNY